MQRELHIVEQQKQQSSIPFAGRNLQPRVEPSQNPVAQGPIKRRGMPGDKSPIEHSKEEGEVLQSSSGGKRGGNEGNTPTVAGGLGPEGNEGGFGINPQIVENLTDYIEQHITATGDVTLKEQQFPVFVDIVDGLKRDQTSGYVELPTGSGKTVIFVKFIKASMGRHREATAKAGETEETSEENKKPLRALVVVPGRQLVRQTEREFHKFAPGLEVGKVYSDEEPDYNQEVTITTYPSLVSGVENGQMKPGDYDIVILDEGHKGLSPRRQEIITSLSGTKIWFTATPTYSETKNLGLLAEEFHKTTVREAIDSNLISGYRVMLGYSDVVDLSKVRVVRTNGEPEFNQIELAKAVNIPARNKSAVNLYGKLFEGQSAVVTCVDIKHAEAAAQAFRDSGRKAEAYHSKIHKDKAINILESFEKGETPVITIVSSLEQGWNSRQARVLINLAPTESLVKTGQRGGRILRLDERDPEKIGVIVDYIDKNSNAISYAQFAGGACMVPSQRGEPHVAGRKIRPKIPLPGESETQTIKLEGLEVLTNVFQVDEYVQQSVARQRSEFLRLGAYPISRITKEYDIPRGILLQGLNELPEELAEQVVYYGGSIYLLPEARDALVNLTAERTAPRAAKDWVNIKHQVAVPATLQFLQTEFPHQLGYFRSRAQGPAGYYVAPEILEYLKQLPSPEEGVVSLPELPRDWLTQDQAITFIGEVIGADVTPADLLLLAKKYPDTAKVFKTFQIQQHGDVQERTTVKMVGVRSDAEEQIRSVITGVKEERIRIEAEQLVASEKKKAEILGGVIEGKWIYASQGTWVHVTDSLLHEYQRSSWYNVRTGLARLKEMKDVEDNYEVIDGELYVRRDFFNVFARNSRTRSRA